MLDRAGCAVQVDIAPHIEMDSYPGPLGQVIANLVSNAVMHGFEGRESGSVALTAAPAGEGQICLLVSDDGIGISPEVVDRIFDPFFTTRLGRGGTGIGLHVVWNAVTAVLGGTVTVASTPGRGTTFRIMLPLEAPRPDAA
jgi:signal transduction histidine kinase